MKERKKEKKKRKRKGRERERTAKSKKNNMKYLKRQTQQMQRDPVRKNAASACVFEGGRADNT